MSIKDRLRQLEDKVDRIERAVCGQTIEIKCPKYEVNINDPEIIGNVMRWKGKDYLDADFVPKGCCTGKLIIAADLAESDQTWIPFKKPDGTDNIEITDALARMRTDDQPIWVMVRDYVDIKENLEQLVAVGCFDKSKTSYKTLDHNNLVGGYRYCRLANIDDLKKAGIR